MGNASLLSVALLSACASLAPMAKGAKQSAAAYASLPIEPSADWSVLGVSRDGASALLQRGRRANYISSGYRWVSIASGAELQAWSASDLTSLDSAGPDTGMISARERAAWRPRATLGPALARLRADWTLLREATHSRFAASGRAIVFDASHALFLSDADCGHLRALSSSAAYEPRISPDGSTVAFAQHVGHIHGHGDYTLHTAPLPEGRPLTRITEARDVSSETVGFSADGARVFFGGWDTRRSQYCFRVAHAGTQRVQSLLCGSDRSAGVRVAYSPSRALALVGVWSSAPGQEPGVVDLYWVRLADGVVLYRHRRSGVFVMGGVSDTGFAVGDVGLGVVLLDPRRRTNAHTQALRFVGNFLGVAWRGDGEIVLNTARGVRAVDLRALAASSAQNPW